MNKMTHTESVAGSTDGRGDERVYGWLQVLENRILGSSTAGRIDSVLLKSWY
jgi:hypothetical protein